LSGVPRFSAVAGLPWPPTAARLVLGLLPRGPARPPHHARHHGQVAAARAKGCWPATFRCRRFAPLARPVRASGRRRRGIGEAGQEGHESGSSIVSLSTSRSPAILSAPAIGREPFGLLGLLVHLAMCRHVPQRFDLVPGASVRFGSIVGPASSGRVAVHQNRLCIRSAARRRVRHLRRSAAEQFRSWVRAVRTVTTVPRAAKATPASPMTDNLGRPHQLVQHSPAVPWGEFPRSPPSERRNSMIDSGGGGGEKKKKKGSSVCGPPRPNSPRSAPR